MSSVLADAGKRGAIQRSMCCDVIKHRRGPRAMSIVNTQSALDEESLRSAGEKELKCSEEFLRILL